MTEQFTEAQAVKLSIALSAITEKLNAYEKEYEPNGTTGGEYEQAYKLRFKNLFPIVQDVLLAIEIFQVFPESSKMFSSTIAEFKNLPEEGTDYSYHYWLSWGTELKTEIFRVY